MVTWHADKQIIYIFYILNHKSFILILHFYDLIISFSLNLQTIKLTKLVMHFMLLITTNVIYFLSLCIFISIWYKIILFKSIW